MQTTDLKPNDVCVILRPNIEDGKWTGHFEIMVAGFGPVTIPTDDMDSLLGVATVVASVVPFMEQDVGNATMMLEFAKEYYGEEQDFSYDPNHDSFADKDENEVITIHTKTVGGMH